MPEQLEATFRIVTPMFLGGANQDVSDGIRPPSVKGALRFWWRALNWGRFRHQAENDSAALRALHDAEARLFGTAAGDKASGGQGCFHMKIFDNSSPTTPPTARDGHKYMLGQGLIDQRGTYARTRVLTGTFSVKLLFRPKSSEEKKREIADAMLAWGLFGGLGSRSRRGLGSVVIASIDGPVPSPPIPLSIDNYCESLKWLNLPRGCSLPPYSAFSEHTRVDASVSGADAWGLLNDAGLEMMRYRGWGFDPGDGVHRVAGKPAEQNFPTDHETILQAVQGRAPTQLPCRAVFGLPHNYFFKSEFEKLCKEKEAALMAGGHLPSEADAARLARKWAGARAKAELMPMTKQQTRRASPLLIHVHSFPDGKTAIIQTLLPARFLPASNLVGVEALRLNGGWTQVPARANWDVIHRYLDRFSGRAALLTGRAVP